MHTPDVLIIGGGIIGCGLGWELARANLKVVVLDRGQAGRAASSAAAGLLSPTLAAAPGGPLTALCYQSASEYESWVQQLRAEGAGDVGLRRPGLLEVWTDPAEATRIRECLVMQAHPERRVEWLPGDELRRREPALVNDGLHAAFYPDDAQVDPRRLVHEVARAAERAGVVIREHAEVHRIVRDGDHIREVHTAAECYHPGQVVIAAGAWSGELAAGMGLKLPLVPVKGQLLQVECRQSPVRIPLHAGEALLVPRPDGRLILGVTVEPGVWDDRVTLDGLRQILEGTAALVPAIGALALGHAWAGIRPGTPDAWPFMGPLPPLHNLWVSTGHFRKGILLAPLCARLMARSILANHLVEDLLPFKPTRRQ